MSEPKWKHEPETKWKVTFHQIIEGTCPMCESLYIGGRYTVETPTATTQMCFTCWDLLLEDSPELKAVQVIDGGFEK